VQSKLDEFNAQYQLIFSEKNDLAVKLDEALHNLAAANQTLAEKEHYLNEAATFQTRMSQLEAEREVLLKGLS
jgi:hypothetical protein